MHMSSDHYSEFYKSNHYGQGADFRVCGFSGGSNKGSPHWIRRMKSGSPSRKGNLCEETELNWICAALLTSYMMWHLSAAAITFDKRVYIPLAFLCCAHVVCCRVIVSRWALDFQLNERPSWLLFSFFSLFCLDDAMENIYSSLEPRKQESLTAVEMIQFVLATPW